MGLVYAKKKNETPSNRLIVREEALALYQLRCVVSRDGAVLVG